MHAQTAAASLTLLVGREAVPHRPSPRPRFSRPGQQLPGPHYWPGHGADSRHVCPGRACHVRMGGKTAYMSGATPGPPGGHALEHPVRCFRLSCSLRRGALIGSCVWRCALTGHNVLQTVHHRSGILYCNILTSFNIPRSRQIDLPPRT